MKLTFFLAAAALAFGPSTLNPCSSAAYAAETSYRCCKVCKKGKACGDSCIAEWKTCHKGKGCACDG